MDNPDVTFIGVAGRDSESAMLEFVEGRGVGGFPQINDVDGTIWRRFGVTYQPTFVFLRSNGSSETFRSLSQSEIQEQIDFLF